MIQEFLIGLLATLGAGCLMLALVLDLVLRIDS